MTTQDKLDCMMALMSEIDRSIALHGDWSGYDHGDICKAVCDEHQEYLSAYIADDVSGAHGQVAELLQQACVAMKGYYQLGGLNRAEGNHLQSLQPTPTRVGQPKDSAPERCCYCLQPVQRRQDGGQPAVDHLGGW